MRILVIDDEPVFLDKLANRLSRRGFEVQAASNGQAGLKVFLNSPADFDVILTDIRMPSMDGIELLKKVRDEDYHTPVIIMSGYDDVKKSIEALRLGAFDYLTKPLRLEQLYSSLSKLESLMKSKQKVMELLPHIKGEVEVDIPSKLAYLENIIAYSRALMEPMCHANDINIFNLILCIQEALTNAVIHGNLGISSNLKEESWEEFEKLRQDREQDPVYQSRTVRYVMRFNPTELEFEIEDEGDGFDVAKVRETDPGELLSSGRGLFYIRTYLDYVEWNEKGNRIIMRKKLKSGN